jgi:hypothetical protein
MWWDYVVERNYIAEGDAACARCEPLRALRDAARAARAARGTKETPDQKWARLETFARENGRVPTQREDRPLHYMWWGYVKERCNIAVGDAACAQCDWLRELRDAERRARSDRLRELRDAEHERLN